MPSNDLLMLTAGEVQIQAKLEGGAKLPRVEILAYSGGLMSVPGWGPVAIDLQGLDISASVPILADHDATLRGIVGQGTPHVADGRLTVSGAITATSDAARSIIDLGRNGFRFAASVGVLPTERVRVNSGETVRVNNQTITADANGFSLIRRGVLKEVSVCALGSDPSTTVSIAASQSQTKGTHMTTTVSKQHDGSDLLPENQEGLTIQERVQARWSRETWHDANGMPRQRAQTAMISASMGRIDYADFESELIRAKLHDTELALVRAQAPKGPMIRAAVDVAPDKVLEGCILARFGREALGEKTLGEHAMQRAADLRCRTMQDIIRAAYQMEGRDLPSDGDLLRASASVISLPTALGNVAAKVALDSYRQAAPTWRAFCAIKSAKDFKQHVGIRLTDIRGLQELAPDGEVQHGSLQESTYTFSVRTYAKLISLTRQDVVNDDLGLFNDTAQAFGRAAVRRLSDLVYTVLLANGGSFFGSGNLNYQEGGGTALSANALAAALLLMRGQVDADGAALDLQPKTLLVPPELEQTAKALLQSDFIQRASSDSGPTGNTLKSALALEVESRLSNSSFTGYSALAWYVFASPIDAPMIVSFLNGMEAPTIEYFGLDSSPDRLGVSWRVYHDFGAALADPKAAVKSKGGA